MRQNVKVWGIALALVAVMALAAVGVGINQAWAQSTGTSDATTTDASATTTVTDTATVSDTTKMVNPVRQAGLDAAAKILGMSASDLSDQLWGGKTLADLAKDANVKLSDLRTAVQDATKTARQAQLKAAIAKQVAAGRITQAHADWINQGIDNGWFNAGQMGGGTGMNGMDMGMNGMGMGQGMGMRGQRGMNNRTQNSKQSSDQSGNSTDQQK